MSEECVRVAVRIRPLLPKEVLHNHQVCVRVVPGSSQVMLGSDRLFSFDHAFVPTASQDEVYESCVQPLVESLLDGYNATIFCYGQTGSGKTYTLGGGHLDEEGGIIDRVAQDLFLMLGEKRKNSDGGEATVRVSYIELYREELRDLLELHTIHKELHIREDERGNTVVVGAKEMVVTSAEELLSVLETGNALRHTGTTAMNEHSSRSHAIFTLQLIQSCHNNNSSFKSVRSSKLCLVDLAGSERAGKTGNNGTRLKESVHINTGLLALGNVIRALSDPARNRRGNNCNSAHIPYRDAKITRLLRDSLGGNAHTLMVACVSPSHHSVAETLSVLQFASKVRHIRNRPGAISTHTEVKSCPTTWDPGEARLGELEYEVQTLRELLKETEREMEKVRTVGRAGEGDDFKQLSQMRMSDPDEKVIQEEPSQYCLLAQEAAALLTDISSPTPSHSFRQRLQDWQERLTAVDHLHQAYEKDCSEGRGDRPHHYTILKLREELNGCKEALTIEEQLLEQKDAELRQVQKEVEKLLQERKTHLQDLEEEKKRTCIQTEHLVDQQIIINRLRIDLVTFRGATSAATVETRTSGDSGKRPHSVPLIRHSCGHGAPRRIHSSPPAYSLERVMAAFKMRGHLLLAEIEQKEKVYSPFIKQQAESKDGDQENEEEDDIFVGRMGFRRSLNRTWTSRQKKLSLKEKNSEPDQTSDGDPVVQPQRVTGTKENHAKHMRKARLRACVTQRRIQELSVNMSMKEELIKKLDKTAKETQAVERHGRHSGDGKTVDVLARLSMQSQQVRAEVYRSLQHMRLQRAQLQSSLRQQGETNNNKEEQRAGDLTVCKIKQKLHGCSWLEEEEEEVLQKRAELQELEEELQRREEVLLRREACLQQKNKLEIKMLQSSQVLSQDLLRVSLRLETLEEQLQSSCHVRQTGGVTIEELEKERDMLKKRRDTLDSQLKDNRVLTVEEEHSLLQLEEAIEALDAALEFKNHSIHDKQRKLLIPDYSLYHSQSPEPAQLCDVIRKLKRLSPPEASELLIKYFNKVVCLREMERHLRLRCEELELHAGEQEVVLREMEVAMQRMALDTDRRLTQQHQDHQNNIQLLLQKLKEGGSGEAQQAIEHRLEHLEKELFFYKSSSRQLKKKLKELVSDALHPLNQPSLTQEHIKKHNVHLHASVNKPQMHTEEVQTHNTTTYKKMQDEQTDKKTLKRHAHQTPCPSSSSDLQARKLTKMPEYSQTHTQSTGRSESGASQSGKSLEMTTVRLCRRELRQISPADLQVYSSTTRRQQPVVDTSTESILEDSIEVPRNTDR
ncbi:kinesin-like protein KIF27 isoform X2 [Etheostoma spectabile]|uniref:kinesin-like protein KIF27 isoform X2 n=1 Tax=Etheostoma spectabile TaxID=54343 RepID=UPI0013AEB6B4|nr:kinesin-like protein KIF27 isoform X2 [Etheostoma spectabile]